MSCKHNHLSCILAWVRRRHKFLLKLLVALVLLLISKPDKSEKSAEMHPLPSNT